MITQQMFDMAVAAEPVDYVNDCERIRIVARERLGLEISLPQAQMVWSRWSDMASAGWLIMTDAQEVEDAIRSFVRGRLEQLQRSIEE